MSLMFSSATVIPMADEYRLEPLHSSPLMSTPICPRVFAYAAWHSLAWLVFANAVGVLLAIFLLVPSLNNVFSPWTYGRWVPVHINLQLYGWCSLPLVGFLFNVYGADREPTAGWCRSVLWIWSSALAVGALSWVTGHSSGKLFLDWTGYSRVLFPLALIALWVLLAYALLRGWNALANTSMLARIVKLIGLALLLAVPLLLYISASPDLYPPINPDTGGPTGASQLESTLVIIAILLLLPFGLTHRKSVRSWPMILSWGIFAAEAILCLGLGRADVSHHRPVQYLSLGSLLVWIPLTPAYYNAFLWHQNTRRWKIAFLCWWSILVPTGWMLFLPGVLDHFKFTDGLVGHSLLAMAGFVSSLLIFVMVQLLGEDGWIFNGNWSFYVWQTSVLTYVLIMFFAGWREGSDAAFSIVPGGLRNTLYALRLLLGILILLASLDWFIDAFSLLKEIALPPLTKPQAQRL
jgi:cytochrome c oxidase cbb3-type subunit 1